MEYLEMAKEFIEGMSDAILRDLGDCKMVTEEEEINFLAYIKANVLDGRWGENPDIEAKKVLLKAYPIIANDNMIACIQDLCEEQDGCTFVDDYSGRFMYGNTCVGIITDGDVMECCKIFELGRKMHENNIIGTPKMVIDNMGYGKIIYFPNLRVDKNRQQ